MTMPTVFVVDDDVSLRTSLEMLFQNEGWKPELFESAHDFLSTPRAAVPSCLVVDLSPTALSGLDLQKRDPSDRSDIPIVFISEINDVPIGVEAMKAGAVDFLMKPVRDDVLLGAVRIAIGRSQAALFAEVELRSLRQRYQALSPREQDVMRLIVRGLLNKQVAFELGISVVTVKVHRGQVMRKMKARSFADLVSAAARLGLPD